MLKRHEHLRVLSPERRGNPFVAQLENMSILGRDEHLRCIGSDLIWQAVSDVE